MLDTIKQFLKEHEIDEKAGFIIAVSGGADSITLLHAFKMCIRDRYLHLLYKKRRRLEVTEESEHENKHYLHIL